MSQMTIGLALHILRNGYGFSEEDRRSAKLFAADQLELLADLLVGAQALNDYVVKHGPDVWWHKQARGMEEIIKSFNHQYCNVCKDK